MTAIRFRMLERGKITVRIYNIDGGLVWKKELSADETQPGINSIQWKAQNSSGRDAPNGVYIYVLHMENCSKTGKIAIVR